GQLLRAAENLHRVETARTVLARYHMGRVIKAGVGWVVELLSASERAGGGNPAAVGPLPGRVGERPASDREERGSADIREEPRPIANKRLDRIGDPIRPVRNHGSVRAGASCPAGDQ